MLQFAICACNYWLSRVQLLAATVQFFLLQFLLSHSYCWNHIIHSRPENQRKGQTKEQSERISSNTSSLISTGGFSKIQLCCSFLLFCYVNGLALFHRRSARLAKCYNTGNCSRFSSHDPLNCNLHGSFWSNE